MVEATEIARKPEPIWRCQVKDCTFSKPPTLKGFNQIAGHQLHHAKEGLSKEERVFLLVDQSTGEVLARTLKEARGKGLLELAPKPVLKPVPELKPEPVLEPAPELKLEPVPEPPEEEPPEEESKAMKGKEITGSQVSSDGIFTYTIALPSDAFTLFNLAKSAGLEKDGTKPFDEWIWDCITARYKYDYKHQLILAPILEEKT